MAIAVAFFLFKLWTHEAERNGAWWFSTNWVALFLVTPIVFWAAVKEFRNGWRNLRFRAVVTVLLVLHFGAHGALLTYLDNWPFIWTLLLGVGEAPMLASILLWLGFEPG